MMKFVKKAGFILLLLLCCVCIHWYSSDAERVENGYSTNIYPSIALFCRSIFGWLPFSFGDFVWAVLILFLLIKIFQLCRFILSKKRWRNAKEKIIVATKSIFIFSSIFYIVFNIFWGINYNRLGIAHQLGLQLNDYSVDELKNINIVLVQKINESKQILLKNKEQPLTNKNLFLETTNAYKNISIKYHFLTYDMPSIKPSMWGWLGNYTGFLGYYNPVTGEAQVNTTVPKFTQPFTTCHEVAHQLGYAKEMEANFVGYLAASNSTNTSFKYSVYVDLFTYANRTLYIADSTAALHFRKNLMPAVLDDFKERRKFNLAHTSFIEPIISYLYSKFLQSNQQPMGILSYDEVTAFIIAYYKKYGVV